MAEQNVRGFVQHRQIDSTKDVYLLKGELGIVDGQSLAVGTEATEEANNYNMLTPMTYSKDIIYSSEVGADNEIKIDINMWAFQKYRQVTVLFVDTETEEYTSTVYSASGLVMQIVGNNYDKTSEDPYTSTVTPIELDNNIKVVSEFFQGDASTISKYTVYLMHNSQQIIEAESDHEYEIIVTFH